LAKGKSINAMVQPIFFSQTGGTKKIIQSTRIGACHENLLELKYADSPVAVEAFAGLDKIFAIRKDPQAFL
jgi:hypothetical protein